MSRDRNGDRVLALLLRNGRTRFRRGLPDEYHVAFVRMPLLESLDYLMVAMIQYQTLQFAHHGIRSTE